MYRRKKEKATCSWRSGRESTSESTLRLLSNLSKLEVRELKGDLSPSARLSPPSIDFFSSISDTGSCLKLYSLDASPFESFQTRPLFDLSSTTTSTAGRCFFLSSCNLASVTAKKPIQAVKTSWLLSNVEPARDCNKVMASPASLVVTKAGPTGNYIQKKLHYFNYQKTVINSNSSHTTRHKSHTHPSTI